MTEDRVSEEHALLARELADCSVMLADALVDAVSVVLSEGRDTVAMADLMERRAMLHRLAEVCSKL